MLVAKLEDDNELSMDYIMRYFWHKICKYNYLDIEYSLEMYIKKGLENKNKQIVNMLNSALQVREDHPWWDVFKEELEAFSEIEYIGLQF
ncbi:hypothetical protein [Paenibacillus glacialis]|uniref:Uncharacterized protein n=1 Tax=Paenibacillus glacialis TaxID=494026 RepID=A0A168M3J4_9BACL|nr:hypothetical protein [Paenibacillus glacialis]OAB44177.1 hypothetical protein PGLA_05770 [Paenibacillus glacialis]